VSDRFTIELDRNPTAAGAAVGEIAGEWDAGWRPDARGGRLVLPVVYGLRHGVVEGRMEIERLGDDRARLRWVEESSRLAVDKSSVAILSIAVVPLVGSIAWPFWPVLFPLVPYAAIFGLIAWWLVISRLRTSGPEEFLRDVAALKDASSSG